MPSSDPFRRATAYPAPSSAEGGVPGAMMAVEAIKRLADAGDTFLGRLMIYDAQYADVRTIKVARRPDCVGCGT